MSARKSIAAPSRESAPLATPFRDGWQALTDAGGVPVVVIPGGNAPAFKGWQNITRWRRETLAAIAQRHATSNIGVSCGASGVTVVDLDTADRHQLEYVLDELGPTPLIVKTPRGFHLYYRSSGEGSGSFRDHPDPAWRRIHGDVKGIGGQVVAPPSARPTGAYTFYGTDGWISFAELPPLPADHGALAPFRGRKRMPAANSANTVALRSLSPAGVVGEGGRNDALFRFVLEGLGPYNGAPVDQLERRALALAHELIGRGLIDVEEGHQFTDTDIRKAIAWPIQRTAAGQNFYGYKGGSLGRLRNDVQVLSGDGDAFLLLSLVRELHGRGMTFALAAKAMAREQVIPSWTAGRYRNATRRLLDAGLLRCLHAGGRRRGDASLFELV